MINVTRRRTDHGRNYFIIFLTFLVYLFAVENSLTIRVFAVVPSELLEAHTPTERFESAGFRFSRNHTVVALRVLCIRIKTNNNNSIIIGRRRLCSLQSRPYRCTARAHVSRTRTVRRPTTAVITIIICQYCSRVNDSSSIVL